MNYVVAALYKFASLPDYQEMKDPLLQVCLDNDIKGTFLLAEEGINGTIAGPRDGIDNVLAYLRSDSRLAALTHKESLASDMPFLRMKVRLKNEIVTLGVPGTDPTKRVGTYLTPEAWNDVISDPEVITVDTRNDYEVGIGQFKGALNPNTKSFRDFPKWVEENLDPKKNKKVAMYCTGGIRCEKSTSYLLDLGFEEVYHLKDGILKYLEDMPQEKSLWDGECFVFDGRVTVGHGLVEGNYDQCHGCRNPISQEDKNSEQYVPGVSCPKCYNDLTEDKKYRCEQRQMQINLARQRGTEHLGVDPRQHRR